MERKAHMDLLGASLLIAFSAVLGLNQALVKLVNAGIAPIMQAGLRSLLAFTPVLLFAYFYRRSLQWRPDTVLLGMINASFFAAEFYCLFLALDLSSVARVSLFFYTMPIWVALAAHFLIPGERLTSTKALGFMVAIGGLAVALLPNDANPDASNWRGDLLSLLGAMCWAGIALMLRATRLNELSPETNLLYQLGFSGVLLTIAAYMLGDTFREPTPIIWTYFGLQVVFVGCIGFLMWIWLLNIYPAAKVTSFSLLTPLFGIFFGWLVFDDEITLNFVIALALVIAGLLLVNRQSPKESSE